jgi:HK97 family phage major capsid protein
MLKVEVKRVKEIRALPPLMEKRNNLLDEMEALTNKATEETRALNTEEVTRFNEIKDEIRAIDETLKLEVEARSFEKMIEDKKDQTAEQRSLDEANFLKFVKGETRALSIAENGGIIPVSIANQIIKKVHEISPIFNMVTRYNVSGDLKLPVYDEDTSDVSADYIEDLTELTESTGKFTTVTLQNHIIGSLAKVSRSLMNRSDFDLLAFIIDRVAYTFARKIEHELIVGTDGKMNGLLDAVNEIETVTSGKITADDLIELQDQLVEPFQANACWHMTRQTRTALKKLKDQYGEYLLQRDLTKEFGWTLLGKPVYITENMPQIGAGTTPVCYCDPTGLALKVSKDVSLQVLNEKFATQNATGVVAFFEADSKIANNQKIVKLKIKA